MEPMQAVATLIIVSVLLLILKNQFDIKDKRKAKEKRTDWDYLLNLDIYTNHNLTYMVEQASYWSSQMMNEILLAQETYRKRIDNDVYEYVGKLGKEFRSCIEMMSDMLTLEDDDLPPLNSETRFRYYRLRAMNIMREIEYIKRNRTMPKKVLDTVKSSTFIK